MRTDKRMFTVLLLLMVMLGISGCSKKMICELCGEEKKCRHYKVNHEELVKEEEAWLCEDCVEFLKSIDFSIK